MHYRTMNSANDNVIIQIFKMVRVLDIHLGLGLFVDIIVSISVIHSCLTRRCFRNLGFLRGLRLL
jgi:hypothetical protein